MAEIATKLFSWLNKRLPIVNTFERHLSKHPVPSKVNFWYLFGALAAVTLIIQIVTGIWLIMPYSNTEEQAFSSIEYIMRDVDYGWVIRYMHTTGASLFFAVVYLHMFRGLLYGSYQKPKELVWIFGCTIYLAMMAEGFLGYVLPYGQMSYWGATVITNLLSPFPCLIVWICGGFYISNPTLKRFLIFHFILPFILCGFIIIHFYYLHYLSSNNSLGYNTNNKVHFLPFELIKDIFGLFIIITLYTIQLYFGIFSLSHPDNAFQVNELVTPLHIVPEWYFLSYYTMLKAIPNKNAGFIILLTSILILLSLGESHFHRLNCSFFLIILCFLWIGAQLPQEIFISYGRILTLFYYKIIIYLLFAINVNEI